jgi:hypothetical protein
LRCRPPADITHIDVYPAVDRDRIARKYFSLTILIESPRFL